MDVLKELAAVGAIIGTMIAAIIVPLGLAAIFIAKVAQWAGAC